MAVFLIILRQELLLNFRRFERILANFLFFLIFVSVFFLLSQGASEQSVKPSIVIWFSLLSCLIFSAGEFLKKDFDDGSLEQALISCENFEIFILAKMLANWLVCCLPILLMSFILNPNYEFFLLIFLASLAANFVCCFCGSLSVVGNAAPMIAVIALPLIIPVILLANADFAVGFKILSALTIFLAATLSFAAAKIIKIAAE